MPNLQQTRSHEEEKIEQNTASGNWFARIFRSAAEGAFIKALKISLIYFLVGVLWIVMSDRIVGAVFTDSNDLLVANIIKGWVYVFASALLLYFLIKDEIRKVIASRNQLKEFNNELEKSNTLFSAILESSPEILVYSIDSSYAYTAFNERHKYSMLRMWGREIQIGMNIFDIINKPEDADRLKQNFDRALSGEYFSVVEEFGSEKNARTSWQDYYSPILARDRRIIGATCFVLNITPLKRAQEKNQYLSYHDNLTDLFNRRYYEEALQRIDKPENYPISIIIGDLNGLKLVNDAFGHEAGDDLLQAAAAAISSACRKQDTAARWGGDEFIILLPNTDNREAEEIVRIAKRKCSELQINSVPVDVSFGWDTKTSSEETLQEVIKNAEDHMFKHKIIESKSMRSNTVQVIMNTLHEKNPREEAHSKRVGEICRKIGAALHYTDTEISTLYLVGFLHDIGKIAIDEGILNKKGLLSKDEYEIIKQHPEIGCRIIRSSYEITEVAEAILSHHERWNGTGYPKGLKGREIPEFGRVIALADSFDAMTGPRTYRKSLTNFEAAEKIKQGAGIQFDPEIARTFVEQVLSFTWDQIPSGAGQAADRIPAAPTVNPPVTS